MMCVFRRFTGSWRFVGRRLSLFQRALRCRRERITGSSSAGAAIENGCYIVAPGQIGQKPAYAAYGNSLVADPWGTVIARSKDAPGITYAEIDLDYLDKIRKQIPSLENRRSDLYEVSEKK